MTCKTCRFFDPETLFCHRYPPMPLRDLDWGYHDDGTEMDRIVYTLSDTDRQALTDPAGWCGEWQSAAAHPDTKEEGK